MSGTYASSEVVSARGDWPLEISMMMGVSMYLSGSVEGSPSHALARRDGGIRADWIQVQWRATIGRTDRFEHVRAEKCYSLAPGGKLL